MVEIKTIDDSYRSFIEERMREYGEEYNDEDFEIYFNSEHTNIIAIDNNLIVAFGCILHYNEFNVVCYTWNDDTYIGKKGYVLGIKHIQQAYDNLTFEENGKRIMGDRL